jgi:hypothetical protein
MLTGQISWLAAINGQPVEFVGASVPGREADDVGVWLYQGRHQGTVEWKRQLITGAFATHQQVADAIAYDFARRGLDLPDFQSWPLRIESPRFVGKAGPLTLATMPPRESDRVGLWINPYLTDLVPIGDVPGIKIRDYVQLAVGPGTIQLPVVICGEVKDIIAVEGQGYLIRLVKVECPSPSTEYAPPSYEFCVDDLGPLPPPKPPENN